MSDFQSYLCRWSNHTELASALIKRDEAWGGWRAGQGCRFLVVEERGRDGGGGGGVHDARVARLLDKMSASVVCRLVPVRHNE